MGRRVNTPSAGLGLFAAGEAVPTASVAPDPSPLGFTYRQLTSGDVELLHHGRRATTLRGRDASDFLGEAAGSAPADVQQLMARLTGNYKRGNERSAGAHPRNRRDCP